MQRNANPRWAIVQLVHQFVQSLIEHVDVEHDPKVFLRRGNNRRISLRDLAVRPQKFSRNRRFPKLRPRFELRIVFRPSARVPRQRHKRRVAERPQHPRHILQRRILRRAAPRATAPARLQNPESQSRPSTAAPGPDGSRHGCASTAQRSSTPPARGIFPAARRAGSAPARPTPPCHRADRERLLFSASNAFVACAVSCSRIASQSAVVGVMRSERILFPRGQRQMHLSGAPSQRRRRLQIKSGMLSRFLRNAVAHLPAALTPNAPTPCFRSSDPVLPASTASRRPRSAPAPATAPASTLLHRRAGIQSIRQTEECCGTRLLRQILPNLHIRIYSRPAGAGTPS